MNHIDLFSGIGGFAYAAQQVWGDEHNIVAFCEINKYCQQVLKKHWENVPICEDIRRLTVDSIVNPLYDELMEIIINGGDMKNYDEAVRMYERGMSIQSIADFYEVTRQAMWMILKRRGCKFRDNLKYGKENHFYRGTKASDRSQNILEQAIENGVIQRKYKCELCGSTEHYKDGRTAIQAHHPNYNKPLDVMWLCQKCHHSWHKRNKAIAFKVVMPKEATCAIPQIDLLTGGFP